MKKVFFMAALLCLCSQLCLAQTWSFVPNQGQWDENIHFEIGQNELRLLLGQDEIWYEYLEPQEHSALHAAPLIRQAHRLQLKFVDTQGSVPQGDKPQITRNNYFLGQDQRRWAGNVPTYQACWYRELYEGIDLKISQERGNLKMDWFVAAGTSPSQIRMGWEGADKIRIDQNRLVIETSVGTLTELAPIAYQNLEGERIAIACEFVLHGEEVSFAFPDGYNKDLALVIDPELVFSTYSGSTGDNWGFGATYDGQGNSYLAGILWVMPGGYPTTAGAFQVSSQGGEREITISKFDSTGSNLLYATYLGGTARDVPITMKTDSIGRLWVLGHTDSPDFPVTNNAYDRTYNGSYDVFVAGFSADGSQLLASTYLGGSGSDGINEDPSFAQGQSTKYNYGADARGDLLFGPSGDVIVTTCSRTPNFPTTFNASQSFLDGPQDAVIVSLNSNLSQLNWSTYFGGNGTDIGYNLAYLSPRSLYVSGGTNSTNLSVPPGGLQTNYQGGRTDGFVARLDINSGQLLGQTYLGTALYDQAQKIIADRDEVIVYGQTTGNWPIVAPPGQSIYSDLGATQFITALDSTLSSINYATTFGSPNTNEPNLVPTALGLHPCGGILVSGWGGVVNYQGTTGGMRITPDAIKDTTDSNDFYIAYFAPQMQSLRYATYFGGSLNSNNFTSDHIDGASAGFSPAGVLYHAACAQCGNPGNLFPTTPNSYSPVSGYPTNCNAALFKLDFGAFATASYALTVNGQAFDSIVCAPATLDFNLLSSNSTDFLWDFGDGSTSTLASPTHTFAQPGEYPVSLTLSNSNCSTGAPLNWLVKVLAPIDSLVLAAQNAQLCITNPDTNATTYLWTGIEANGTSQAIWQGSAACLPDSIWASAMMQFGSIQVKRIPSDCVGSTTWAIVSSLESESLNEIVVYPNPAQDELFVGYQLSVQDDLEIRLLDLQGRTIKSLRLNQAQTGEIKIPIEDMAAGMYLISCQAGSETYVTKWIKQ